MKYQKCFGGVRYLDAPNPDNIRRLDLNAMPLILNMQANGILVDKEHCKKLSVMFKGTEDRITEEVKNITGHYINIGSPDQIAGLLFDPDKLALSPPAHFKKIKSGKRYIVDDEALESIKNLHPCVRMFQDFTEVRKLRTSYADVLPTLCDPIDGRVRATFRITRQVGGRVSVSDPPLQAQPTRSDLGKEIRNAFVAQKGWKIGTIDQSQIEMRAACHDAECELMTETFINEGDIHSDTASRIFRIPIDKLDKMKHRYPAKRIGFGILFGITEEGLRDQILVASDKSWTEEDRQAYIASWPLEECARVINLWYETYPEIRSLMSEQYARARRYNYVWDWWGRIRPIPEVKSVHKRIVAEGLRQAGSLRVSSSAQGTMKLSMAEIQYVIDGKFSKRSGTTYVKPLIQVHDELLFEGEGDSLDDAMPMFQKIINGCVRLTIPIKSGYGIGERWGLLEK